MSLSYQDVKEILDILDASPFDEMKLETEGLKLQLRRSGCGEMELLGSHESALTIASAETDEIKPTVNEEPASPTKIAAQDNVTEIRAPMLGIFYRAPKPGAEPFVELGKKIGEQTVVCVIEVMKLMNSITAQLVGELVEVCAKDGELVEFDQVLFRVKG